MNSIMERWVPTCRHELLNRTLIWNERHLRYCLHQLNSTTTNTALTRRRIKPHRYVRSPNRSPTPDRIAHLDIRRNDRLGGIIHEYQRAA